MSIEEQYASLKNRYTELAKKTSWTASEIVDLENCFLEAITAAEELDKNIKNNITHRRKLEMFNYTQLSCYEFDAEQNAKEEKDMQDMIAKLATNLADTKQAYANWVNKCRLRPQYSSLPQTSWWPW